MNRVYVGLNWIGGFLNCDQAADSFSERIGDYEHAARFLTELDAYKEIVNVMSTYGMPESMLPLFYISDQEIFNISAQTFKYLLEQV